MENLILIHGALGSEEEFNEIIPQLETKYRVYTYEIPHHGKEKDSVVPFKIKDLIKDFRVYLDKIGPSYIYGFSLGGYIALSAAIEDESNIKGIITQATKLKWSNEIAELETQGLYINFLQNKARSFYDHLLVLHGDYLPELLEKTAGFMKDLGAAPIITPERIKNLSVPVRLTRGGRDNMVTKEETLSINGVLPNSYYFEIPSMVHPLSFISPKNIARLIQVQLESFKYKWIDTDFGIIAFRQFGKIKNENEPVVLFLHEAIGSIAQWQDFPTNLCEELQFPGIALELPGYGFSEKEDKVRDENYLHEFALEYLPSFLKAIQINNPLIIVGHSDGGTNALLYSTRFPKQVHSIVTMAAHYINEPQTRAGIQPAIEAYQTGKLKGLEYFHGDKTERLFFAWANTWNLPKFKHWDISEDIKGNTKPALIIQGDDDQYGTDNQVSGIVKLLDNAEAIFIKECGHAPHLEKQEEVINAIKKFLENL